VLVKKSGGSGGLNGKREGWQAHGTGTGLAVDKEEPQGEAVSRNANQVGPNVGSSGHRHAEGSHNQGTTGELTHRGISVHG
jgi:hypothetical protein